MITSTANPRVRQIVQYQLHPKERGRDKVFVAEGVKMYLEAPENLIQQVYISAGVLEETKRPGRQNVMDKLVRTGYETVSDEVFAKMSDTRTPQGILALMRQPEYELEPFLQKPGALFLVLEGLQDPGNLGTIIRTGEGAGVTCVIIGGGADLFNPKVIRATMGSIYRVPFVYSRDLPGTVEKLHAAGIRAYAAHLQGEVFYDSVSFREPSAFLIGNEGRGLSRELAGAADAYIKIPMEGQVESLNAAVAAALLMYEAHRQRAVR